MAADIDTFLSAQEVGEFSGIKRGKLCAAARSRANNCRSNGCDARAFHSS